MHFPLWLHVVSVVSLAVAGACALVIILDLLAGHRQHMWIMNVVWPVTALYFGPLALWAYFKWARLSTRHRMMDAKQSGEEPPGKKKAFWQMCAIGATHCGSGCTLGDIATELLLVLLPFTLFGRKLFAKWVVGFALAFLFGIAFQYFTIKPMRNLSPGQGITAALKADSLSLTAWQLGMYGWMAIVTFLIFRHELNATSAVYWFLMQIGMWFGFLTSYPINWWLLKKGIKEKM